MSGERLATSETLLTEEEAKIVELLAEVWNLFVELPLLLEWDSVEFMHVIHDAQRMILSRPVVRAQGTEDE
jgi:hypothetical protein